MMSLGLCAKHRVSSEKIEVVFPPPVTVVIIKNKLKR